MAVISIKQLLEAGVHFGHQTGRWNPKMKPFIFGERNGVHIIDLQKTLKLFKEAVDFVTHIASQGKTVLFVGTKSQAQETIEEEARRCGMYWVNNRWLGGLLTNFATVQNSIKRYRELESMRDNGFYEKLSKKEAARLERERKKLEKNLRGIRDINRCPDALFVVDSKQETIAVREAAKLKIPIIAIVDTNCDPDLVDYIIPGNDDALRAVKLFTGTMADAILVGKSVYTARVEAEMKETQEKAAKEEAQRQAAKEAKEAARLLIEARSDEGEVGQAGIQAKIPEVPVHEGAVREPSPEVAVQEVKEGPSPEEKEIEAEKVETVAAEQPAAPAESAEAAEERKKEKVSALTAEKKQKKAPPKKKIAAKKSKATASKTRAAKSAQVKKSTQKSKKTASKTRKTTSTKSKATKHQAKSNSDQATTSKKSSAKSDSSAEAKKDKEKTKPKS